MATQPAPERLFTVADFRQCWPMAAEKTELDDGHPHWLGDFGAADVEAAERAFPGRSATLSDAGLLLHASTCRPGTCRFWPPSG
jgi:hypothetical protein